MTTLASNIQAIRRVSSDPADREHNQLISQWQDTEFETLMRVILEYIDDEVVQSLHTLELARNLRGFKNIPGEGNTIWLDYIGQRIGNYERPASEDTDEIFGFKGSGGEPFNHGRFASAIPELTPRNPVSDDDYVIVLDMAIRKELSRGTIRDITNVIRVGYPNAVVQDNGDLSLVVHLNTSDVRKFQQYVDSNVLVKPAGVDVKYTKASLLASTSAGSFYNINPQTGVRNVIFQIESQDFDTLAAAGNGASRGMWSNGTTMWVADFISDKIYAYNLSTKVYDSSQDFSISTLNNAGNNNPTGIWSDGTTMWVADYADNKLYAYNLSTKAYNNSTLTLDTENTAPQGIWSDGTTMWVADETSANPKIYAYNMSDQSRDTDNDFDTLMAAGNNNPTGIWSDGTTMWVADSIDDKIYAYNMSDQSRDADNDFDTLMAAGNNNPTGIWSDGITMWVADSIDDKIYAHAFIAPVSGTTTIRNTSYILNNKDNIYPIEFENLDEPLTLTDKFAATDIQNITSYNNTLYGIKSGGDVVSFDDDYDTADVASLESSITDDYSAVAWHKDNIYALQPSTTGALYIIDSKQNRINISLDGGSTLESRTIPLHSNNGSPRGVSIFEGKLYTADNNGNLYISSDEGVSWVTKELHNDNNGPSGIAVKGTSVYVLDSSDDAIYVSTNDGDTWNGTTIALDTSNSNAQGIDIDGNNVYVVDGIDDVIYQGTLNTDGTSINWLMDTIPLPTTRDSSLPSTASGTPNPSGIAVQGNDIYVLEYSADENDQDGIYHTTDDGANWNLTLLDMSLITGGRGISLGTYTAVHKKDPDSTPSGNTTIGNIYNKLCYTLVSIDDTLHTIDQDHNLLALDDSDGSIRATVGDLNINNITGLTTYRKFI